MITVHSYLFTHMSTSPFTIDEEHSPWNPQFITAEQSNIRKSYEDSCIWSGEFSSAPSNRVPIVISIVIRNKKIHLVNRSIRGHWNEATTNHIIALFLKIPTEPKLRLWWGYRSWLSLFPMFKLLIFILFPLFLSVIYI